MSFEGAAGCPHAGVEKSRAQWMAAEGRQIFEPWTLAVTSLYEQLAQRGSLGTGRYDAGPSTTARDMATNLINDPNFTELTHEHLMPHLEELRRYTSLDSFIEPHTFEGMNPVKISAESALRKHAQDSILFGIVAPVFTAQTQWLYELSHGERPGLSLPRDRRMANQNYLPLLHDAFGYITGMLVHPEYRRAMHEMAATGFDTLSVKFTHGMDLYNSHGAYEGAVTHVRKSGEFAGDEETPPFLDTRRGAIALAPEFKALLRRALYDQNHAGLSSTALIHSGQLENLETPLSSGCPVKAGPSIDGLMLETARIFAHENRAQEARIAV